MTDPNADDVRELEVALDAVQMEMIWHRDLIGAVREAINANAPEGAIREIRKHLAEFDGRDTPTHQWP